MTQPDATPFAFPSNLHSSLFLRFQIKKDKQKYGNATHACTQAEFRSFNEVCKQIAYACMCFLISSFFFWLHILNLLHSSRGSLSSLLLRCKRALHFFFPAKTQKSHDLGNLHDYNSKLFLSLTCCIRKHGSSLDATRMTISRRSTTVCWSW